MPIWDAAGLRLLMTEAELAPAGVSLMDAALPDPATEMLRTVARPAMRLLVQLFTSAGTAAADPPVTHRFWLAGRTAVLGRATGGGGAELSIADTVLVPYTVAQLVGLRRSPAPQGRRPIRTPLVTYRAVEAGRAELPELAAVLRSRRVSWRVSSAVGAGASPPIVKWLHVTDAGPAGLWRITVDRADSGIELTPLRATEVWRALRKEVLS